MSRFLLLVAASLSLGCWPTTEVVLGGEEACDLMKSGVDAFIASSERSTVAVSGMALLPPPLDHSLSCSDHWTKDGEGEVTGVLTRRYDCSKPAGDLDIVPGMMAIVDPCAKANNGVLEMAIPLRARLVRADQGWRAMDMEKVGSPKAR